MIFDMGLVSFYVHNRKHIVINEFIEKVKKNIFFEGADFYSACDIRKITRFVILI